jgi:hypothetical protein
MSHSDTLLHTYFFNDGAVLEIHRDPEPPDPRDWDNLGRMLCGHKRYVLGDKHPLPGSKESLVWDRFGGWNAIEAHLRSFFNAKVVLPLYLMDHSGQTMQTQPFGDPWDSGQVGFIFATADDIRKNFLVKRLTKKHVEQTEKQLQQEVVTYNDYMQGNCFGFTFQGPPLPAKPACETCKHQPEPEAPEQDSCWGFFLNDSSNEEEMLDLALAHVGRKPEDILREAA